MKVIHAVSVMNRAGQETFIMNVYRNIDRTKIQFDFQCSVHQEGDFDDEIEGLGGRIFYLEPNTIRFPVLKYFGNMRSQYRFFKEHTDYQVFHIHTYHAFDAWLAIIGAKSAGVKNVCLHSHNTHGLHPKLHYFFRQLLNHMKLTRFACSYAAGEWMYGEKFMREGRAKVIKNGIQVSDFKFDENQREVAREKLDLQDKFIVGHVGRFNYQKNHMFLLEIFAEIKKQREDAVLLLVGTGELKDEIVQKVEELGIQDVVKFLGVRTDITDLLFAMDLFLFPSLFEGLSVVAIEAQAAGVPVLAADTLTEETKLTNDFYFMPLDESSVEWAEESIRVGALGHSCTAENIRKSGYDITDTTKQLSDIYLAVDEERKR